MNTKKISYTKEFLSGMLAGISVPASFGTTEDALTIHLEELGKITRETPGRDVLGDSYFVRAIAVEDIPAAR